MDFDKLDWNKYQIRFNQKSYNQLSIMKDNKIKHVITFHFLGMIDSKNNIFYWANLIPGVNQNFSKQNNKIKQLKNKYQDFKKNNQVYYQLLNENMIHMDDNVNPDFIRNFFHQLLQKPIIILNSSPNQYQIISVEKINESY